MNHRTHNAHVRASAHSGGSLRIYNVGMAIAALLFLVYYVMQVNALASQTWGQRDANERLAALHDERNALVAQQAAVDDRSSLTALAQQQGLVPAGSVVYLVQDHSVAAAR